MMEIIKFMYFWLIHSNKSIHPERIPVAVKTMNHHFYMAIETPESDTSVPTFRWYSNL